MKRKKRKLSLEHKEKLRIASLRAGCKPPSVLGKKHSLETRLKMSLAQKSRKGRRKLTEFEKKRISLFMQATRQGSNNPAWRGGRTKLNDRIRTSKKYIQWRNDVFKKDNWTCRKCGKRGTHLEAHHIRHFNVLLRIYRIKNIEQALNCDQLWSMANGLTLCKVCHNKDKNPATARFIRVYVAGRYSDPNILQVFNNMRIGMRMATQLLLLKYVPFCPFIDYHFSFMLQDGETLTVQEYYDYSMAWLMVSDVVLVLPHSETSIGTQKEIAKAKELDLPVYTSLKKMITEIPPQ